MGRIVYGYIRISTNKQDPDRQKKNILNAYPEAKIVKEVWTGTKAARPVFDDLIFKAKSEAASGLEVVIVFEEIGRMTDLEAGIDLYQDLFDHNVELEFLKEPYFNTRIFRERISKCMDIEKNGSDLSRVSCDTLISALNNYTMDVLKEQIRLALTLAEQEKAYRRRRTSEGLAAAGATNKYELDENGNKVLKEYGSIAFAKRNKPVIHKRSQAAKAIIKHNSEDFEGSLNDIDTMKLAGVARNTYYKLKKELREEAAEEELVEARTLIDIDKTSE